MSASADCLLSIDEVEISQILLASPSHSLSQFELKVKNRPSLHEMRNVAVNCTLINQSLEGERFHSDLSQSAQSVGNSFDFFICRAWSKYAY